MGIHRGRSKKSDYEDDEMYEGLDVCLEVMEQDFAKANKSIQKSSIAFQKSTSELQAYLGHSMKQLSERAQDTAHNVSDGSVLLESKLRSFQIPSLDDLDNMTGLRLVDMEEDFGIPFSKAHEVITEPMVMNGYGYKKEVGYEVDYDTSKSIIAILDEEESLQASFNHVPSKKRKRFSLFRRRRRSLS